MVDSWWLSRAQGLIDTAEYWQYSSEWKAAGDAIYAAINEFKTLQREPRGYDDWDRNSVASGMWDRLMSARTTFKSRRDRYFDELNREAKENARRKQKLCDRAESIASSTSWKDAATEIKELQINWKAIGSARGDEEALWQRFRRAVDGFFGRRQAASDERIRRLHRLSGEIDSLSGDALVTRAREILTAELSRSPAILPPDRATSDMVREKCVKVLDSDRHPRAVRGWIALAQIEAWVYENAGAPQEDIQDAQADAQSLRERLTTPKRRAEARTSERRAS